jgi:hypothetical protein
MADWHLARNGKTLGVYPEDQLRDYVREGRVAPTDLVWTSGMEQWRPAGEAFAGSHPAPPRLHWGWVLLLTIVTFGLFYIVWAFVQAVWVHRRIDGKSRALYWLVAYLALSILGEGITGAAASNASGQAAAGALVSLVGVAAFIAAAFSVRRSLLQHYNRIEPIGLELSGVMTFFFGVLYFQFHFTRIAKRRDSGT